MEISLTVASKIGLYNYYFFFLFFFAGGGERENCPPMHVIEAKFFISPFVPSGVRLFFSQRDLNFPPQKKEREEFLF